MQLGERIDPVTLRNRARDIFIAKRSIQEQNFNMWYQALLGCSKERVLDKIPFDYSDLSLQKLIPEWYAESPRKEVCDEQLAKANEMIGQVNKIIEDLNAEGLKLLEEYNTLYGQG